MMGTKSSALLHEEANIPCELRPFSVVVQGI